MNIGIIGATGFLGSYLLRYFKEKGHYKLYAFDRDIPLSKDSKENVMWKKGDISSKADCEDFINSDLDSIIYLAHTNTPLSSDEDMARDAFLNLGSLLNFLDCIKKKNKLVNIVYPSSGGSVYGISKNKKPFKETDPCYPISSYGIQKLAAEHYLRILSENGYITTTILRISNPYGLLLPLERKQGLIGVALNRIKNNQPVYIFGNPNNVRDYIHLEDVSTAFELSIKRKKKTFDVYNIGSGKGYSVYEVLSIIEKSLNRKIEKKIIEQKNADSLPDWNILEIAKVKQELLWEPGIRLERGVELLCRNLVE